MDKTTQYSLFPSSLSTLRKGVGADELCSEMSEGISDVVSESHVILHATKPESTFTDQLEEILNAYNDLLHQLGTNFHPVFMRFFISDAANQADIITSRLSSLSPCATSIIQQPPLDGTKIALWIYLIANTDVHLDDSGFCIATHGSYRHLWAGSSYNTQAGSELQTLNLLNDYTLQLAGEDCTLADNCIRTWFFVNDIDNNYQGVVKARNQVFFAHGLTKNTHFIASTGIGGRQANHNVAVQMDTYSIKGINPQQIHYLYAPTHLNRTSDYGVSFERGTYVDYGDRRHVFISGTASIDNRGRIMYPGNITRQTQRMIANIQALLTEAQCTWDDVASMIIYLRDIADYTTVSKFFATHFPNTPHVIVNAPVCRPGWLIEAECIAIKSINTDFPSF